MPLPLPSPPPASLLQQISIHSLAERLGMDDEATEKWIVNLIRWVGGSHCVRWWVGVEGGVEWGRGLVGKQ